MNFKQKSLFGREKRFAMCGKIRYNDRDGCVIAPSATVYYHQIP